MVTHLDALQKADHKPAKAEAFRRRSETLKGRGAMLMNVGIPALDVIHEQHVAKVQLFLSTAGYGYVARRLGVYEALKEMRHAFVPAGSRGWRPRLTLRDCTFRTTEEVPYAVTKVDKGGESGDLTFMLPPKLSAQMVPDGVAIENPAFDVTPATYVTAIVTERGVAKAPYGESLAKLVHQ